MENRIKNLRKFQEILTDYHIETNNSALIKTKLVLLIGPTGSGRDTIIRQLEKTGHFKHLVSSTTRRPRINNGVKERSGVEYWFRSEEEMLDSLRSHRMLEAEIIHKQHVSGISLDELERATSDNKIAITNVELNVRNIIKAKPDAIPIMVLPPNFEEWLRRLSGRGILDTKEVKRRLQTAEKIYLAGLDWNIFYFVVNDEIENAVQTIRKITEGKNNDQKPPIKLIKELLAATGSWLKANS